ncbi:Transglutaminase-like superfamily protein [Natronincola peptidivorans]|uniref:Transglutaminase-like superfamily protein n=1 Tax=Natronincola peptidivorans TaxID=426128 RepID=A0A1I0BRL5_9FIRM|nr:transglutaminase-like domain-containing protein [Natronincola peptidivorans]SET09542.1 Transglutaminase-like superfamily protein [Natronincola peptidivorans]
MKLDSCVAFYYEQGLTSSPGAYQHLLDDFPTDIPQLCESIHKFMLIDLWVNMQLVTVQQEYLNDSRLRSIEEKLREVVKRDDSSLKNSRDSQKALLGNCRDLSLMLCSILRYHKIPARLRSGFASFFDPFHKKNFDHWVCEYWNRSEERWIMVDIWMSQIHLKKEMLPIQLFEGLLKLHYNPYDVKGEDFMTGGEAWVNCRENGHDPENYGTEEEHLNGMWFVRDNMIRDLLCLNKLEPLPWDCWGMMGKENSVIARRELEHMDKIAKLLNTKNFSVFNLQEQLEALQIKDCILKSLG